MNCGAAPDLGECPPTVGRPLAPPLSEPPPTLASVLFSFPAGLLFLRESTDMLAVEMLPVVGEKSGPWVGLADGALASSPGNNVRAKPLTITSSFIQTA